MALKRASLMPALLLALACVALAPTGGAEAKEPGKAKDDPVVARGEAYTHLMRSLFAARRGEFRVATSEIRKAIELQPDSPQVHIQGASLMLWMGRTADAEELARKALDVKAEDPEALRFLADIQAARALGPRPDEGSRVDAVQLYEKLVELGHEDEQLLRKLTGLKLHGGDQEGALKAARRLAELRPGDRSAAGMLSQLLSEDGQDREALLVLLRFIAKHPNEQALIELAETRARDLNAWRDVTEILLAEPGFADRSTTAHRLLGEALLQQGRLSEATRALENALSDDPSDRMVRYHLSLAYRRANRLADAAVLALHLALETPDDPWFHLLLAETLEDQGDLNGALNSFISALRVFSAEDEPKAAAMRDAIRRQMASLYLRMDRLTAAQRTLRELEVEELAEARELAARIGLRAEDWAEVRQEVKRLRGLGEEANADLIEGELLARTGRWAKAEAKYEASFNVLGPAARVRAAETYFELDRREEAEKVLRAWVDASPTSADAHFFLGEMQYRLERFDDCEASMREAIRLDPEHSQALNFLGYSLAERKVRLEEALELIQRAVVVDEWNGAYLDSLGWVYYQMGRFEEARGPLEQAAREHPKEPTILEHLGDLYHRVGETELALAAWDRALDSGPEDVNGLQRKIAQARERSDAAESVDRSLDAEAAPMRP